MSPASLIRRSSSPRAPTPTTPGPRMKSPRLMANDSGIYIEAFVQAYTAGPACLLQARDGKATVTARSASFQEGDLTRLQEWAISGGLASKEQTISLAGQRWQLTYPNQPEGDIGVTYAICIGQERAEEEQQLQQRNGDGKMALLTEEDWFAHWRSVKVPGLDSDVSQQHIESIRNVEWHKTPLGPIKDWHGDLLSAVSQILASPYPVHILWGPELIMIYNHACAVNYADKHPRIMGMPYKDAWSEIWDILGPLTVSAWGGTTTHTENAQVFMNRGGYLEETFFTWSMIPLVAEGQGVVGLSLPNFETTKNVITDRRLRLLRQTSQSFDLHMTVPELFRRVCSTISKDDIDLPLLAFYDCSVSDDTEEMSQMSSAHQAPPANLEECADADDGGKDSSRPGQRQRPGKPHDASKGDHSDANKTSQEEMQRANLDVTFVRTVCHGAQEDSKIFPPEIPPSDASSEETVASHPSFLKHFRQLQKDHKHILLQRDDLKEYRDQLDKTSTGDTIQALYLMPITTIDDHLRAIAIIGLNPRKRHDEDYQVFLDLLQAQLSHGVTSIRLVNEELRRSRFVSAIVKRKNDELAELLAARTSELRHSELKFLKMAEINPAGIWRATIDRELTFVNESWWNITGHPRDKDPSLWAESIYEEDLPIAEKLWEECLTSRKPIAPIEHRWKSVNGRPPRWSWSVTSPEFDQDGRLIGVTGSLTDVTGKKELEALQQRRMEDAIESRRAQERFIDMTSHEMRNPLSAISLSADASAERLEGITQALSAADREDANILTDMTETLSDLKTINLCCTHMTRLIDDVLTLSKLDNQFLVVTPVPTRPVDFMTETASVFKAEMLAKDIHYQFEITPAFAELNIDYVLTDPSRINQLVINLVTNAIKFTAQCAKRSIKITLDCSATRPALLGVSPSIPRTPRLVDDSHASVAAASDSPTAGSEDIFLLVSIADSGRGLTAGEISGLFQRFKQANPKTHISYGGSGLGLFICRRIVALLNGEIGVTSERGKGSTFQFYVQSKRCASPLHSSDDSPPAAGMGNGSASVSDQDPTSTLRTAAPSPALPTTPDRLSYENDKIAVLIVEDNLVNQKLLEKHLARMGCLTTCANNGREAIDLIKQSRWASPNGRRIDCVLMDIEMPVLDGMDAIKEIRGLQRDRQLLGHVPVLAVSANARQEQVDSMLSSGFDGTVSKPFKVPAILEKMRSLLRERTAKSR